MAFKCRKDYLENLRQVVATDAGRRIILAILEDLDYSGRASSEEIWIANYNFCRLLLKDIACVDVEAAKRLHAQANGWEGEEGEK